ncbi:MAG: class I SAM-dependent methyltransferase [Mobilitalea sp.]
MKKIIEYFNEEAMNHDELFIKKMGMVEFYDEIEHLIESSQYKRSILVLGCGTGLEIERIKYSANVTAIDIADKMLDELRKKQLHKDVQLTTICGSLLELDFGINRYDIVLSCYVMHHFNEKQKLYIYNKVYTCLTEGGAFINGDSMEKSYEEEQMRLKAAEQIYAENNLPFATLHIDAPFCLEHEIEVLNIAGFSEIILEKEWSRTKLYRTIKKNNI